MSFDHQIILLLQSMFSSPLGRAFAIFCSRYLIFVLVGFLLVLLWTARFERMKRHSLFDIFWSALLAFCLAAFIGHLVDRSRPFFSFSDIIPWIPLPLSDTSFPSRHASIAFALATGSVFFDVYFGIVALILAIGVAFGRVATGVHYPTDVLAGVVVGVLSVFCVRFFHRLIRRLK